MHFVGKSVKLSHYEENLSFSAEIIIFYLNVTLIGGDLVLGNTVPCRAEKMAFIAGLSSVCDRVDLVNRFPSKTGSVKG